MSEAKPKCCGQVSPPGSYRSYNCGKNASLEHDGKHYCKLHHPPTVWAKRDARNAKWDAEWEEKKKKAAEASTAAEEQKRRADAYDQLVERVKELEEALRKYEDVREDMFGFFLSNGIFNQWGKRYDCAALNNAHLQASAALSKARPNTAEGEAHADSVLEDAAQRWAAPKYGPKQREWCIAYETETGFDPMMDDYEAGLQTFAEAAVASLRWYEDHTRDAHLRISGKTIPGGPYDAVRAQEEGKA